MVKNETLHIRANENVKINAEKTLGHLGISISGAVNMLLHQIPLVGVLPFGVGMPLAPESVIAHSREDLYGKIAVGLKQIEEGRVIDSDIAMSRLRDKYGF